MYVFGITFTMIIIAIKEIIQKIVGLKHKKATDNNDGNSKSVIPIGYYLCITNIICLIITNYYIFAK